MRQDLVSFFTVSPLISFYLDSTFKVQGSLQEKI